MPRYKFHEGSPVDWVKDPVDASRLVRENQDLTGLHRKTALNVQRQGMGDFGRYEMVGEDNRAEAAEASRKSARKKSTKKPARKR